MRLHSYIIVEMNDDMDFSKGLIFVAITMFRIIFEEIFVNFCVILD